MMYFLQFKASKEPINIYVSWGMEVFRGSIKLFFKEEGEMGFFFLDIGETGFFFQGGLGFPHPAKILSILSIQHLSLFLD